MVTFAGAGGGRAFSIRARTTLGLVAGCGRRRQLKTGEPSLFCHPFVAIGRARGHCQVSQTRGCAHRVMSDEVGSFHIKGYLHERIFASNFGPHHALDGGVW